jgi:hypothetical protein
VVGGNQPRDQHGRDHPDRHVHQEHRAPGGAEQVGADQQPADHLAEHRAAGERGGVDAERAGAGRAAELPLDDAEDLRDHRGGAGALHQARRDQRAGARGEPARQRRGGEGAEPGEEQVAVPQQVAEAGAGDQQHRVADRVAGDHQLQRRTGRVQPGVDGGDGDVDDGHVEQRHELPGDQDGEHQPAAPLGAVGVRRYGGGGRGGHGMSLRGTRRGNQEPGYPGTATTWHQGPPERTLRT